MATGDWKPEARVSRCPSCGGVNPDDTVWVYQLKFYCSESCVAKAMTVTPSTTSRNRGPWR